MKTFNSGLPVPANEKDRIKALHEYGILDTLPEEQLDRLTKLASIICEAPIALISLVDSDRQWLKSRIGIEAEQTSREVSFCQYTIMNNEFFEVEDALQDNRFKENPLVTGEPKIRFYAAYPLIDPEGFALGSLCVIDQLPKKLSANQKLALKTLSDDIMLQIVSDKKNQERKKLETLFMMSRDMICIAGMDGYFKKVNPAFCSTLGCTEQELLQNKLVEFVHPEDVKNVQEEMIFHSNEGTKCDFVIRLRTGNNIYRQFHWVANSDLKTGELFCIARDITEQKIIENDLKQAKLQADSAKEMQEQFLANMSHEIRTPMNAILGFSTILSRTELNQKQDELVTNINIASENLLGIINDILDLSKIESGMIQVENTVFHLPEHLEKINMLMMGKALEKNLEFSIRISPGLPDFVNSDPTRLSQILINLISNAIKFTDKGFVNVRAEISRNEKEKLYIKFIVQDSGIGISSENKELIFERFKQESSDTTRKYGGTGLGLSIAKNMVELLGGELSLESELGKGSEFMVVLPVEKCDENLIDEYKRIQSKVVKPGVSNPVKLNILLVEDNRMNRQYCSILLSEFGYSCTAVDNGIQALKILKDQKFDFILMDIQMPEMDGYEATRIIRNEMKITTPILALTANAMPGEQKKTLLCGMDAYISKPFKPTDLFDKINEIYHIKNHMNNSSAGTTSEDKLLDLNIINENANGKVSLVKQLFTVFIEDIPLDLINLNNAIIKNDFKTVETLAHKLISSYSIIGIHSALNILKSIENNASRKEDMMIISTLNESLNEITDRAKLEITELRII